MWYPSSTDGSENVPATVRPSPSERAAVGAIAGFIGIRDLERLGVQASAGVGPRRGGDPKINEGRRTGAFRARRYSACDSRCRATCRNKMPNVSRDRDRLACRWIAPLSPGAWRLGYCAAPRSGVGYSRSFLLGSGCDSPSSYLASGIVDSASPPRNKLSAVSVSSFCGASS